MPRDDWGDRGYRNEQGYRGDERRDYWSEGENIRSEPRERDRGSERYAGTRDMDFGGGYGGGRDRGGGSWDERGGGRGHLAGTRDMDDRWNRERWDRDRAGSRGGYGGSGMYGSSSGYGSGSYGSSGYGGGSYGSSGSEDWRRSGDEWGESRRGESRPYTEQGPGGGYRGGWGGTGGYGSSTGGYGASGLTGSTGWGRGGAGYSGDFGRGFSGGGGGFGGGGSYGGGRYGRGGQESYGSMYPSYGAEFGAQSWRGESRSGSDDHRWGSDDQRWGGREHEGRGFMERMGDTFREGMAKLTGRGPKGYKRSDDRIREDVCERIARSSVNAENVEVQVDNGEVTLTGEVENRMDKRRLEDMIDDIFGVDEVHNNLRLRRETQTTTGTTTTSTSTDESRGTDSGLSHH